MLRRSRRRARHRNQVPVRARSESAGRGTATAGAEVNHWIVVKPDDTAVIRIARAEMGQGTHTGLAQLVAEELECDWKKLAIEPITAGQNLARKRVWGDMSTGGSRGIRTSQDYLRRSGAAARMMLLQAAADEWKVPVGELTVVGRRHQARGVEPLDDLRQSRRRGLEAHAAGHEDDQAQGSAAVESRRQADEAARHGAEARRRQIYAIDMKLPGMLNAAIKQCPVFGGKLVSYDEAKIAKMPGVQACGQSRRSHRRGRRGHVVAREDRARRAADRVGRRRRRESLHRDDRTRT